MTTRTDPGAAGEELPDARAPRLRRRSNGAEHVVVGEMLVGRGLECDIVISDGDSISRRHAQLSVDGRALFVADLGSTNGTHVNGREVTDRTALADGDVLAFDEYEFDVVFPPAPAPADPEATRLVDRDELVARLGRDPFGPSSAEPADADREEALADASGSAAEDEPEEAPGGRPAARAGDGLGLAAGDDVVAARRDVADDMADDEWSWPDLDDDIDEPVIELADDPSPSPPEPEPESEPEPDLDPAPASTPAPVASVVARPDDAGPDRARPTPARADDPRPEPDAAPDEPDRPDVAALPGAWANVTAVHGGNPEHTVIAKYVAPRPKTPPAIDPSTLDGPALLVGTGDPAGQVLPLAGDRTEWVIGSGAESDLRIRHEGVSARHAVLSREGGKWRLCDELSVNGTYANAQRLNAGYVGDGDELRFGPVECRLVIPKAARGSRRDRPAGRTGERTDAPDAPRVPWKPIAAAALLALVLGIAWLLLPAAGP